MCDTINSNDQQHTHCTINSNNQHHTHCTINSNNNQQHTHDTLSIQHCS